MSVVSTVELQLKRASKCDVFEIGTVVCELLCFYVIV